MCPYCCKADQAIMLSSCKHIICVNCYNQQAHVANSDLESEHFPLVCLQSGRDQPISLSDLRKLIPVGRVHGSLHSIFEASAQAHIYSHPEKYRKCRLTDCDTIYLLTETPQLFTCSKCLTQTCTYRDCGASPHIGLTCEQYKVRLLNSLPTHSRPLTSHQTFTAAKPCPRCGKTLDNVKGHRSVRCTDCRTQVYWGTTDGFKASVVHNGHSVEHGSFNDAGVRLSGRV